MECAVGMKNLYSYSSPECKGKNFLSVLDRNIPRHYIIYTYSLGMYIKQKHVRVPYQVDNEGQVDKITILRIKRCSSI